MNFRVGNIVREISYSLRRNPSLFLGTVATIMISLLLVGSGFVVGQAVDNMTARWRDGVEFIVFLNADATPEELTAMDVKLQSNPEISEASFVDKAAAYEEFKRWYPNDNAITSAVGVDDMPPSYRVVPRNADADIVETLADEYRDEPGVLEVVAAVDTIEAIESLGTNLYNRFLILGFLLLVAASLLVYNTIRTTIFSRRSEIEVMRLVGASNWYIRIPFMLEGVLQGMLAGLVTFPMLGFVNNFLAGFGENENLRLLSGLRAPQTDVFWIWIFLIFVGIAIGAIASAVALSRYLDV